ncbi:MAG: serpin family protein [Bacteroidales bacterium]|nr:serpin family protein [Bacteroidales bacterium]
MKTRNLLFFALCSILMISCQNIKSEKIDDSESSFDVFSPTPTEEISRVSLSEKQTEYVNTSNDMAFKLINKLYNDDNLVCSPLSLQYAMAMTANGASGETLEEITSFLGFEANEMNELNRFYKILLEQLPAVDLDITLKAVDALLVNDKFPLLPSYKNLVEDNYYAAVENMDFSNPSDVVTRLNEWAGLNTNGVINNIINPEELSDYAAAYILNALYFKAEWEGSVDNPMFIESNTESADFQLSNGTAVSAEMMKSVRYYQYAEMDGYKVLVLPYAQGKYNMYVLLPDENDINGLIEKIQQTTWSEILANLKQDAEVHVQLPKFEIENKFNLAETLISLGVEKVFQKEDAELDNIFDIKLAHDPKVWIEKIIQQTKISVDERGTEAASVSIEEIGATSPGPGEDPKIIYFHADHPFMFVIGEKTSGTILFEGVVARP